MSEPTADDLERTQIAGATTIARQFADPMEERLRQALAPNFLVLRMLRMLRSAVR